jgi:hypothetical protein
MAISDNDPDYYRDDEDGEVPHGHWLKSPDWERKQREHLELINAIREGRACDLRYRPINVIPF